MTVFTPLHLCVSQVNAMGYKRGAVCQVSPGAGEGAARQCHGTARRRIQGFRTFFRSLKLSFLKDKHIKNTMLMAKASKPYERIPPTR